MDVKESKPFLRDEQETMRLGIGKEVRSAEQLCLVWLMVESHSEAVVDKWLR